MLKNYLLVALRSFRKQKGYAAINILGLSVGLASAIIIFLYIHNELSYDSMFPDADNTYRLGFNFISNDGNVDHITNMPGGWDDRLMEDLPEVINCTQFMWMGLPASLANKEADRIILTEDIYWTEPNIAEVMYFPFLKGNAETALEHPNSIILSERMAIKLFGDEDPFNREVVLKHQFATNNEELVLTVTGVVENYPDNTHFKPDIVVNYFSLKPYFQLDQPFEDWTRSMLGGWFQPYVVTTEDGDGPKMEQYLTGVIEEFINNNAELRENINGRVEPVLRNVRDLHYDQEMPWENEGQGNMMYIYTFASIAILIITIACINYMNLATARSAKRSREVGMRKALGGQRSQLIIQFMVESILTVFIASLISLLMIAIFLPTFNSFAGKAIQFSSLFNTELILIITGLLVFVGLVSGSYPAFFLSGFNPVRVLKGQFSFSRSSKIIRMVLVSLQFAIAIVLVIATAVVIRQMNVMHNSKLNRAGDQILSIRYGGTAPYDKYQTFKNMLVQDKDIELVTYGNHLPRLDYFGPLQIPYRFAEISEEEYTWNTFNVDYDFVQTFELELVAGRSFEEGNTADSASVILNETAVKALGLTIDQVMDQAVSAPSQSQGYFNFDYENLQTGKVIGVVKDFPYQSAYSDIEPLIITAVPHFVDQILYVKLPDGMFQEKIGYIESVWKQVFPGIGLDYWFVNDEFNRMYKTEIRAESISRNFAVLAMFITCIGLFGLASFIAEQKTKEIGIRKALGASSSQILLLLLSQFTRVLVISAIIAVPLAWYLTDLWLQSFAVKTTLSWFVFAMGIVVITSLTVLTVSYESLKASLSNPVRSLKYE